MTFCLDNALTSGSQRSPFERLLALDVYDGPVHGIAFCRDTQQPVVFRMLAWDNQQTARVYALSPIPQEEAGALVNLLSRFEEPRWPEWWLLNAMVEEDDSVRHAISHLMLVERASWYVAISRNLLDRFEAMKKVEIPEDVAAFRDLSRRQPQDAEVAQGSFQQWLQFIGGGAAE